MAKEEKRAKKARADADLESFVSASRQEFPTKTRGEPVFLSGDQEKLARINERERRGRDTLNDRIEKRAIYQRQGGLPEGESWIDPEAAKAGQLNELISAATMGTPLPSWATADDLADAADLAKEMFRGAEVSDALSREAMIRAKDAPPLDVRRPSAKPPPSRAVAPAPVTPPCSRRSAQNGLDARSCLVRGLH